MPTPLNPARFPAYLYGMHDVAGRDGLAAAQFPGWILDTVDLGHQTGNDYSSLAGAGFGLLVRLNNGYGTAGTIPPSDQYSLFASKCASYVAKSPGAQMWIIGNEMNLSGERPSQSDGSRETITPDKYAQCFLKCRAAIRKVPGHSEDFVIPGAIGPYNTETVYPGNVNGDWVQYFLDILKLIGNRADGLALHCYTHAFRTDEIASEALMAPPFNNRHYHFRAYRDFLNALPDMFRSLPVFITETNPASGWRDSNIGWMQAAYDEIDSWNSDPAHQPIQALIPFRWSTLADHPEWGIQDKQALISDFRAALAKRQRLRWPEKKPAPSPSPSPDYRVQWLQTIPVPDNAMAAGSAIMGHVVVKNAGNKIWNSNGTNPVRLGYRWHNARGEETPVPSYPGHFRLPNDVVPNESTTFDQVELRAPKWGGTYTLKWDLYQEGVGWFSARQSPMQELQIRVDAGAAGTPDAPPATDRDPWAVLFLGHDTPVSVVAAQVVTVNLRIKNKGASTWAQAGNNPVHVGYKWFNSKADQQMDVEDRRTALPSDTLPNQEVTFGAILAAPKTPGKYSLRWDLVAEGLAWFADAGNPPLVVPVTVTALPEDIGSWRVESNMSPQEVAFALDGDTRTVWDSHAPQSPGQWFRLNLSAPRQLDGIQFLSPGKGVPSGYSLRISPDGMEWTEVQRVPSENNFDVMAVFASQLMQYAQIDLLATPAEEWNWMISEILIHLATPWTASASTNNDSAGQAIDNRWTSAWSSETPQQPGMWFQIDLGRTEKVSGLSLTAESGEDPVGFRVSTWDAATGKWQIALEKADNTEPVDAAFDSVTTQFVNIQLTQAGPRAWSIRKAEVSREMDGWLGPTSRP